MNYPVNCKKCNQLLYGPVKYCPFCGTAFVSVSSKSEKQNLNSLRDGINSLLMQGEYTPAIKGDIRGKGKELSITEEVCDSLLLAALKEKEFSPEREIAGDPLSVCWYPAEKRKPKEVTPQQPESTITEKARPEPAKPEKITPQVSPPTERPKIPDPLPPPPPLPPPWKKVVAAIVILAVGYFAYNYFIGSTAFLRKIDQALSEKKYFSPSGNNVADLYRAKKAEAPNSPELNDAVSRIRQKLEPMGDDAFQRLYSDSIDAAWDNTVDIYKLLNEILPDDRDMAAKAEFCQAHQIIKGKKKKNYVDALARYQKALELKPNWVFAINGIAKVYIRKDSPYYNKDEALNWYNKASEADPKFPWAYTNIAAIYMEDKQWDMAEQALLNALKIKNNSSSILTELGKACEKQEKRPEAKNYYQEAMKYEKDSEKVAWLQKKISAIQ